MKKSYRHEHLGCFLSVVLAILILSGCSQKAVNDDAARSIALHMKVTEPALIESVTQFFLIVTGPGMDTIETELALSGGHLEGEVDVPAGRKRKFEIRALDKSGNVIYRGSTTVDVEPGETIELTINLYPVVPLVKLSPRFQEVGPNSPCSVDVKVFRIRDLYDISFGIHYDGLLVYPDSAALVSDLDPNIIMLPPQNNPDSYLYSTRITQTDEETPIVDENGNATLARFFFTTNREVSGTAQLTIEVTGLTRIIDTTVPVDGIFTDGSLIEVQPDTSNPIVSFPDPILDSLIRDMIGKNPSDPIFESDVDTITYLSAVRLGITHLDGLSYMRNLDMLVLDVNSISDIEELSNLTSLTFLALDSNEVSNISALASLVNVEVLSLNYNQISDIHPLIQNAWNEGIGAGDEVYLRGNPSLNLAQLDSLCLSGAWVEVVLGSNWCQPPSSGQGP